MIRRHAVPRELSCSKVEITGRLEHPGIVPVYGLGHFPDGRPFYAMRFIRGSSLKSAIRRFHDTKYESHLQKRSDFRRLIERFPPTSAKRRPRGTAEVCCIAILSLGTSCLVGTEKL